MKFTHASDVTVKPPCACGLCHDEVRHMGATREGLLANKRIVEKAEDQSGNIVRDAAEGTSKIAERVRQRSDNR